MLDFRKFNSCIRHEPFLPVNREFSLAAVKPFIIGSALDLSNAYLQVPLHPYLWHYLGVIVEGRFFEYTRQPFGYNNSPHEFLRALWPALCRVRSHVHSQVLAYMDDILLLSSSEEEYRQDLQCLFTELGRDGWKINWNKCHFCPDRFDFLGVTLTPKGMFPSPLVFHRFEQAPMLSTQQGWRRVQGWLAHSSCFIWRGHHVLSAFAAVRRSPSVSHWRAFLSLLRHHFVHCVLPASASHAFTVLTNASKEGWRAVLLSGRQVVRCASGLWPSTFCNRISNELELEALCHALRVFRPWIFGTPIQAIMDNQAAVSLRNPANLSDFFKVPPRSASLVLSGYSFLSGTF